MVAWTRLVAGEVAEVRSRHVKIESFVIQCKREGSRTVPRFWAQVSRGLELPFTDKGKKSYVQIL